MPEPCFKEKEIEEAVEQAKRALEQADHIYRQIEELRNINQKTLLMMMRCKDEHRNEIIRQLHMSQLREAMHNEGGTSIQVNPVIGVGEHASKEPTVLDNSIPLNNLQKSPLAFILAMCLGAGSLVAVVIIALILVLKYYSQLKGIVP